MTIVVVIIVVIVIRGDDVDGRADHCAGYANRRADDSAGCANHRADNTGRKQRRSKQSQ